MKLYLLVIAASLVIAVTSNIVPVNQEDPAAVGKRGDTCKSNMQYDYESYGSEFKRELPLTRRDAKQTAPASSDVIKKSDKDTRQIKMADSKALAVRKDMKASLIHAGYSVIKDLQKHIKLWWDGSITARECAKKCAESCKIGVVELAEAGAGYKVGGIIGGVIGTMCGGTLGGMIGNAIGGAVGGAVDDANDWLVGEIFGSNKKVDLKNAYSFLGVSNGASMDAVNKAYKKKALEHHPDKGGNTDDFVKLHTCIALIKISKGCE